MQVAAKANEVLVMIERSPVIWWIDELGAVK
jgi:hypothetical protein